MWCQWELLIFSTMGPYDSVCCTSSEPLLTRAGVGMESIIAPSLLPFPSPLLVSLPTLLTHALTEDMRESSAHCLPSAPWRKKLLKLKITLLTHQSSYVPGRQKHSRVDEWTTRGTTPRKSLGRGMRVCIFWCKVMVASFSGPIPAWEWGYRRWWYTPVV